MAELNDTYDIIKAIKSIEKELIASMIANLDHHRAEETKEKLTWSQWQVVQLQALEEYKKKNAKKYGTIFEDINKQIDVLISMQRQAGNSHQEEYILNAIKNGAKLRKPGKNIAIEGAFFKLNDRKINALINATVNDMKKGETAILRMTNDQYRKIIYNAQIYAASGATYKQAVDMATKDFLRAGINCIEYSNGSRHTLSEYADMAIRTAQKRAYLTGEGEVRKAWGVHTVIMNKRLAPCPKCLPFAGKVLIDDVWSGGSREDGPYPLMSKAIAAGLYHPRCQDVHTTYFEGISTPPDDNFTKKELNNILQEDKEKKEQQYYKRQVDSYERMAEYSLDENNKTMYMARAGIWKSRLKNEKLEKSSKYDKINLSEEEQHALNQYISFEAYIINEKLRKGTLLNDVEQQIVKNLDNALKKMPFYKGNISRSLYFGDKSAAADFVKKLKVGDEIMFPEFISTTCSKELYNPEGEVQVFIFNSRKGRNIIAYNKNELEVLYERKSKFTVMDIKHVGGNYNIILKEIIDE